MNIMCSNYILMLWYDSLYDIYSTFATAREIWESLEKKYRTQVACSKKFVVGKFLNFKMNDAKPVQLEFVLKIRVEEDNRMIEKADANSIEPNANLVGESSSKSKSNHKNKGKNGGIKLRIVAHKNELEAGNFGTETPTKKTKKCCIYYHKGVNGTGTNVHGNGTLLQGEKEKKMESVILK
ncbi:hypothetical protein Tco_0889278 [Tanacetum coccineum]